MRVKTDTTAIDDWNYFDYVKLSGFREPPPGLVDPSSLLFVPPPNMDCVTSFKFSLSDCAGSSSSRMFGPHEFSIRPPGLAEGGAECVPRDTDVLNIGLLLPMYNAAGEFQSFGPQCVLSHPLSPPPILLTTHPSQVPRGNRDGHRGDQRQE